MKRIPTLFTFSECHPNYRSRQHIQQKRRSWKKGHVLILPWRLDFYHQSFQIAHYSAILSQKAIIVLKRKEKKCYLVVSWSPRKAHAKNIQIHS